MLALAAAPIPKILQSFFFKPFTRFTLAKSLDDLTDNKLSELMNSIIRDRSTGCFIIGPKDISSKINETFLVKLSTAIAYLIGIPNHDAMAGKYYARFHVKHEDKSDSYLRKAYTNMDLHTDGTYVKEKTDWLLMSKLEEKNVEGEVTPDSLRELGLTRKKGLVKVLGDGEITKKIDLKIHAISEIAKNKIESAGGTVEIIEE